MTTCKHRRPNAILNRKKNHAKIFERYLEMESEQIKSGNAKFLARNFYWENLADEFNKSSSTIANIVNRELNKSRKKIAD